MKNTSDKIQNRINILKNHLKSTERIRFQPTNGLEAKPQQCNRERAVIVTGQRTPFIRSFTSLMDFDTVKLGCEAVKGLINKTKLDPNLIDEVIWGSVVQSVQAPNVAREIILDLGLPYHITGVTVSRACLSGVESTLQAVRLIESGNAQCVIAGGGDSTSNGEITLPRHVQHAMGVYQMGGGSKKGISGITDMLSQMGSPTTWGPVAPAIAERSTGKTMGYHACVMSQINKVPREAQDEFAMRSHKNAALARKKGYFKDEITPIHLKNGKIIDKDSFIREKQDPEKLKKLKPCFRSEKEGGTITAATSSPLTDGASCVLVMAESLAKKLGYPTDVTVDSYAMTAVNPFPQLLIAPAIAIPKALRKGGLTLQDIDTFEFHEAFAGQVLATLNALNDKEFCKHYLKQDKPYGKVPMQKINPNGSSIALGHPFAATGGRLITSAANEMRRSGTHKTLISVCAAGGLGGVVILSRNDPKKEEQKPQEEVDEDELPFDDE